MQHISTRASINASSLLFSFHTRCCIRIECTSGDDGGAAPARLDLLTLLLSMSIAER